MSDVILFPGQGAQYEGMGLDWAEASSEARETYDEADRILDFPLSAACWSSGDEAVKVEAQEARTLF